MKTNENKITQIGGDDMDLWNEMIDLFDFFQNLTIRTKFWGPCTNFTAMIYIENKFQLTELYNNFILDLGFNIGLWVLTTTKKNVKPRLFPGHLIK